MKNENDFMRIILLKEKRPLSIKKNESNAMGILSTKNTSLLRWLLNIYICYVWSTMRASNIIMTRVFETQTSRSHLGPLALLIKNRQIIKNKRNFNT